MGNLRRAWGGSEGRGLRQCQPLLGDCAHKHTNKDISWDRHPHRRRAAWTLLVTHALADPLGLFAVP